MSSSSSSCRQFSDAERYAIIDRILIMYQGFQDLLDELDFCHLYTQSSSTHNPPCLAILGATGAGKTKLIEEWLTRHNNTRTELPSGSHIPYLYVSVPAQASIKGTATAFLTKLGDPNPGRGTQWNMVTRLHMLLKSCHVRMIFVDEFQHAVNKDTQLVLHAVTDFLKDIINQSAIPMILVGQTGEAEPILLANPQLSRRVGSPRYLHPFPWDRKHPQTITEFCTILESIDLELPLDRSGLENEDMAYRIHYSSDGYIGWVIPLLRQAARLAIKDHCPTLNRILLQHAFDQAIAGSVLGINKKNPFAFEHFIE